MKTVFEKSEVQAISVTAIMKGSKLVGKCVGHYSRSGVCTVSLFDFTTKTETQTSSASGYGSDKFTSALGGMTFAGYTLRDHCEHVDNKRRVKGTTTANGGKSHFWKPGLSQLEDYGFTIIDLI